MDEQTYLAQITRCTRCPDMCACCCPVFNVLKSQSVSPSNKAHAAQMLAVGLLDPDPTIVKILYQCNNCRLCAEWCIYDDLVLGDLLKESRSRVVQSAPDSLPPYVVELIDRMAEGGSPYAGLEVDLSGRVRQELQKYCSDKGEILVFEGCFSQAFTPDLTLFTLKLLKRLEIEVVYLPDQEPCCGAEADLLGFRDQALHQGQQTAQFLRSVETARVLALDPLCAYQLGRGFSDLGIELDLEVLTLPAFFESIWKSGGPDFKELDGVSLVVDDDPVLARYLDQADLTARLVETIPGCTIFRTQKSGKWAEPALSCAPLPNPQTAAAITSRKVEQLDRTGADKIVTSSPRAYFELGSLVSDRQRLIDLSQLFLSVLP
jgi:Fe-S oxidoreductase